MSSAQRPTAPTRVTLPYLADRKALGEPIVVVTAHDFPTAQVAQDAGVDIVLVGDSAANTVLGYESTVSVTVDEMLTLTRAVRRGLAAPLLIGDLPFGSYEASDELAIRSAQRFVKEAGCDAVKLEGGGLAAERARAIVASGIPVMGHIGLTPQTATALGGFRAQGRTAERASEIRADALRLEDAGCFAIVIEAVPGALVERLMAELNVVVIGIGAGPATDGQVLVVADLLGFHNGHTAKFVRKFADTRTAMEDGMAAYVKSVRDRTFPAAEHTYEIEPAELTRATESWR